MYSLQSFVNKALDHLQTETIRIWSFDDLLFFDFKLHPNVFRAMSSDVVVTFEVF